MRQLRLLLLLSAHKGPPVAPLPSYAHPPGCKTRESQPCPGARIGKRSRRHRRGYRCCNKRGTGHQQRVGSTLAAAGSRARVPSAGTQPPPAVVTAGFPTDERVDPHRSDIHIAAKMSVRTAGRSASDAPDQACGTGEV